MKKLKKLIDKALEYSNHLIETREEKSQKMNENWQMSEKGEAFVEATSDIEMVRDSLQEAADAMNEVIDK